MGRICGTKDQFGNYMLVALYPSSIRGGREYYVIEDAEYVKELNEALRTVDDVGIIWW